MLSCSLPFRYRLQCKVSKWQLRVQPMTNISSKWHFRFGVWKGSVCEIVGLTFKYSSFFISINDPRLDNFLWCRLAFTGGRASLSFDKAWPPADGSVPVAAAPPVDTGIAGKTSERRESEDLVWFSSGWTFVVVDDFREVLLGSSTAIWSRFDRGELPVTAIWGIFVRKTFASVPCCFGAAFLSADAPEPDEAVDSGVAGASFTEALTGASSGEPSSEQRSVSSWSSAEFSSDGGLRSGDGNEFPPPFSFGEEVPEVYPLVLFSV